MWFRSPSRLQLHLLSRCCSSSSASTAQKQSWIKMAGGSDMKDIRERLWNSFLGSDVRTVKLPWSRSHIPTDEQQTANTIEHEIRANRVTDSKVVGYIPLRTNAERRISYMNLMGGVRVGLLLEDMDIIAAYSAYMHCSQYGNVDDAKSVSIVTALVDRLDFHGSISLERDIRLTGLVSWVGTSSMEVSIMIDQEEGEGGAEEESTDQSAETADDEVVWKRLAEGTLVMVGRNPVTNQSKPINFLQLRTPQEIEMYQQGERRKVARRKMAKESLIRHPPNTDERAIIHELFLKTIDQSGASLQEDPRLPEGAIWMSDTRMSSVRLCHPQYRNIHNKIFGGYLMRQAFELAWTSVSVFTKSRACFIAMDETFFRCPVEVGDMLEFKSQVVFTKGPYLQVSVSAEKLEQGDATRETSNLFHFTFASLAEEPRQVLPRSYSEAMLHVHGMRCHTKAMERVNQYSPLGAVP